MSQIDERDTMFARMSRVQGTSEYIDYYKKNPDKKEIDDLLRKKISEEGKQSKFYNPETSAIVDSTFKFLSDIKKFSEGPVKAETRVESSSESFTKRVKGLAEFYGAKLVGIAPYEKEYYYSHRGRMDENYGEIVDMNLPYTIVFAVEMDAEYINNAPTLPESIAVTKGYADAAIIGMMLTYYIKELGYDARNHMDGNYLMVMPLAARAAGLGDIGRHGLLISPEYGSRIRLGAVSTNLPLNIDKKSTFNVNAFCEICNKCSKFCPSKAIPSLEKQKIDGVDRWKIIQEKCFEKWVQFGTDCGMCLAVCPFSFPMEKEDIQSYIENNNMAKEIFDNYSNSRNKGETPEWLK